MAQQPDQTAAAPLLGVRAAPGVGSGTGGGGRGTSNFAWEIWHFKLTAKISRANLREFLVH